VRLNIGLLLAGGKLKTLVIYDIEEDRIRSKIFEACKDYGLTHIQYSAFFGELNHNRRDELKQRIKKTLGRMNGKILICPVCDKDLRLLVMINVEPGGIPDA
jgi:CRISPR-associated protein Cas2